MRERRVRRERASVDARASGFRAMQTLNARSGVPFGDSVTSVSVAERGGGTRVAAGCVDGAARVVDLRRGLCHVDRLTPR